ncbi:MAG: copper-binding protein [Phycisphaerales bacterium]
MAMGRHEVDGMYNKIHKSILFIVVIVSCTCLPGCSGEDGGAAPAAEVVHTYTLRGRIVSMPSADDPASELRIHHEAIDTFKSATGEAAPMKAMTMTFPPAEGVTLEGLAVGDAVEFVFRMQWEPSVGMSTTSITKLPADTELTIDGDGTAGHDAHAGH